MTWLIDDGHLGAFLRTNRRPKGIRGADAMFTTGYWYVRLCQALFGVSLSGILSGPFERLEPDQMRVVMRAIAELPDEVGLLSLRTLGPVIGGLRRDYELNVLSSEALAAALDLRANVLLSAPSPRLEAALRDRGLRVMVRVA